MIQEDKELLKDLCARLPYGVKCQFENTIETIKDIWFCENENWQIDGNKTSTCIYAVKPYLFPMSSMTDEQYYNFIIVSGWDGDYEDIKRGVFSCVGYIGIDYIYDTIDWLNKNHFDYRGLIEKGLAIDATGKNVY